MDIARPIHRILQRASPKPSHPKYAEWQTASICIFVRDGSLEAAVKKARKELEKRHWQFLSLEHCDTLVERRIRDEGGAVEAAFDTALRTGGFFIEFLDDPLKSSKGQRRLVPARISESFVDEVVLRAGGQRLDTAGIRSGVRNADYRLGRYIFELKDMQEEAMTKEAHQEKLAALFSKYAQGASSVRIDPSILSEEDHREYLNILGKPIQKRVISAADQIKQTKEYLKEPDLLGGLIIANTGYGTFPQENFAAQVERYARKDTKQIDQVVSICVWTQTNGFDTVAYYDFSPHEPKDVELIALRDAFDLSFTEMMTKMIQGQLPANSIEAPIQRSVGFSTGDIDFFWEAPSLPLSWGVDE